MKKNSPLGKMGSYPVKPCNKHSHNVCLQVTHNASSVTPINYYWNSAEGA